MQPWLKSELLAEIQFETGNGVSRSALKTILVCVHELNVRRSISKQPINEIARITQLSKSTLLRGFRYLETIGLLSYEIDKKQTCIVTIHWDAICKFIHAFHDRGWSAV